MTPGGADIRDLVDQFLGIEKDVEGDPRWAQYDGSGEFRLRMPLSHKGQSLRGSLEIQAYPDAPEKGFSIGLYVPQCVWRLDHRDHAVHTNPPGFEPQLGNPIHGPHVHRWTDNRAAATSRTLPDRLPCATPFDQPRTRQFDQILRWACAELNIAQGPLGMIELPPKTRLL